MIKKTMSMSIRSGGTVQELNDFLSTAPPEATVIITGQPYINQLDAGSTTIKVSWNE